MTAHAHHQAENKLDIGQLIKWTVYVLLLLNWGFYFWEEWVISGHTLRQGGTFLEWTEAFATSIDELGWFGLLLAFELETYVLDDDAFDSVVLCVLMCTRGSVIAKLRIWLRQ